jgi:hypothetical protein
MVYQSHFDQPKSLVCLVCLLPSNCRPMALPYSPGRRLERFRGRSRMGGLRFVAVIFRLGAKMVLRPTLASYLAWLWTRSLHRTMGLASYCEAAVAIRSVERNLYTLLHTATRYLGISGHYSWHSTTFSDAKSLEVLHVFTTRFGSIQVSSEPIRFWWVMFIFQNTKNACPHPVILCCVSVVSPRPRSRRAGWCRIRFTMTSNGQIHRTLFQRR